MIIQFTTDRYLLISPGEISGLSSLNGRLLADMLSSK